MCDIVFDHQKLKGKIVEVYGTQERFAKAIGKSPTALNMCLNNKQPFKQEDIFLIAKSLNIPDCEIKSYFFTPKVQKTKLVNNKERR